MIIIIHVVGTTEGNDLHQGTPLKYIFCDIDIVCGLVLAAYSGTLWSSIDPILEPELRNKVSILLYGI